MRTGGRITGPPGHPCLDLGLTGNFLMCRTVGWHATWQAPADLAAHDGKTPRSIEISRPENRILRIPDTHMMLKQQQGLHDMLQGIYQVRPRATVLVTAARSPLPVALQPFSSRTDPSQQHARLIRATGRWAGPCGLHGLHRGEEERARAALQREGALHGLAAQRQLPGACHGQA